MNSKSARGGGEGLQTAHGPLYAQSPSGGLYEQKSMIEEQSWGSGWSPEIRVLSSPSSSEPIKKEYPGATQTVVKGTRSKQKDTA